MFFFRPFCFALVSLQVSSSSMSPSSFFLSNYSDFNRHRPNPFHYHNLGPRWLSHLQRTDETRRPVRLSARWKLELFLFNVWYVPDSRRHVCLDASCDLRRITKFDRLVIDEVTYRCLCGKWSLEDDVRFIFHSWAQYR
ncbi:hypothetical protein B0T20DRAFT_134810 [Sordaria brevicollis]|uniref:Secreted protein n=1 Tax=Sordaria brevicollis TaxID=83679 RepID=A0AAE0PLP0_SORBR|nr:hypothetical protein B0T20DRAFT_134810 [Sordaria brevicollis]